eukprot:m.1193873 g.1193873  ORF g.1193873 m.1193873 type:complete len:405 (+) comp24558_c0_seq8:124-1338(+)
MLGKVSVRCNRGICFSSTVFVRFFVSLLVLFPQRCHAHQNIGLTKATVSLVGRGSVGAIYELLTRVLQNNSTAASHFLLEMVDTCSAEEDSFSSELRRSHLCFTIGPTNDGSGRVKIQGTSGVELARGAATYLRQYCNMSFSWQRTGGNQVSLPDQWPPVGHTSKTVFRRTEYSYFQNVVESSYSFAFYGWSEWEYLIDWQALSGINLALAYTGQEEVYRKTFNAFGVNNSQFGNWSNGPAWLAWSRGQSMHGVGSGGEAVSPNKASVSLTLTWMRAQADLQRKILARMRAIGIVAILPAFQGNVPPVLKTLHPTANISLQGTGRHYAAWLDATDPLFGHIADRYMTTLLGDYGTDHWYEADGYFTAGRPRGCPSLEAPGTMPPQTQDTGCLPMPSARPSIPVW